MDSDIFIKKIENFIPSKQAFITAGYSEDAAERKLEGFRYSYKGEVVNSDDQVINLISNYDLSKIEIGGVTFRKEITESASFIFFGNFEVDFLAISKVTGEIVMIDYNDTEFIMCACAANSSCFLDALLVAWQGITGFMLDEGCDEKIDVRKELCAQCTELAGGEKYYNFYYTFVGPNE